MTRAWLLVIAACGAAPRPPPLDNATKADADAAPRCEQVDPAALARPTASSGAIAGVVIDPQTRAPVEGATVVAIAERDKEQIAVSDACGVYTIGPVRPGTYSMFLYVDNKSATRAAVTVKAGAVARASWRSPDPALQAGDVEQQ